jgi:uncharacterized membrane protein
MIRDPCRSRRRGRSAADERGSQTSGGGCWGLLFGLIFFIPLLGLAIGAASGALIGSLADAGISDAFIKDVRDKMTPGSSALFALTSDAVRDKVAEAFRRQAELISTNVTGAQEAALVKAFSDEA